MRLRYSIALLVVLPLLTGCSSVTETTPTLPTPVEQYVARYDGPGNGEDMANAMAVDATGNVFVTGLSTGNGTGWDYATVKYNNSGKQLWVARYNGPGNGDDVANSLVLDSKGNVYITGWSVGNGTSYDYATIKYDNTGTQLWVARYNGSGNGEDLASSLAVDSAGNVYVTGWSTGSNNDVGYTTIKYDNNGNQLWVALYKSSGNGNDFAHALAVDMEGNVYVTGEAAGTLGGGGSGSPGTTTIASTGTGYYATIKYDNDGNQLWEAKYKGIGNGDDIAHSLKVDKSGNVYVTGESLGNGTGYDYATIKYDGDGKQLWVTRYNGAGNGNDGALDMGLDGLGNICVTGYSAGSSSRDYATIKYDSSGKELWTARYSGLTNGDNVAHSLVTDSAGNVYVAGQSGFNYNTGTYEDYATIKYDENGSQVWIARYSNGQKSRNLANSLTLDTAGNVYVTGGSTTNETDYDYVTTKYKQP
jgi:hypothetical protein